MSKLIKNLQKTNAAVTLDTYKGGDLAIRVGSLAVKAITGGIQSDDWKRYMALFADNDEQFDLLTTVSATDPAWMAQSRAYIVSNAVCDANTNTKTGNGVDTRIDTNLNEVPGGNLVPQWRPFDIPNV